MYDGISLKKKRQIQIPADKESSGTDFVTYQFTFDSKSIIAVNGEPEWNLYVFRCDKGKLESTAKANNLNGTGTVNEVRQQLAAFAIKNMLKFANEGYIVSIFLF